MKSRSVQVDMFFKAEYSFVVTVSSVADLSSDYKSNDSFEKIWKAGVRPNLISHLLCRKCHIVVFKVN